MRKYYVTLVVLAAVAVAGVLYGFQSEPGKERVEYAMITLNHPKPTKAEWVQIYPNGEIKTTDIEKSTQRISHIESFNRILNSMAAEGWVVKSSTDIGTILERTVK